MGPVNYHSFLQNELLNDRAQSKKEIFDEFRGSCYLGKDVLDEEAFKLFVKSIYDLVNSVNRTSAQIIKDIFKSKQSPEKKLNEIVDVAQQTGTFDQALPSTKFKNLVQNDADLNLFLQDPNKYVLNKKLSLPQTQSLQEFYSSKSFQNFLHQLGKRVEPFQSAYTECMQSLGLQNYASRDALRFKDCINPTVKSDVLTKSKKPDLSGRPKTMGFAGVQLKEYTRKYIDSTAKEVKAAKAGECHTLAQLGAKALLDAMESGKISAQNIKIVSHDASLGSHTFILVGHNTDDLNDLSKCIIIDPWAVAMGYANTNGVFDIQNYPYPQMTTDLKCVYESKNDAEHMAILAGGKPVETRTEKAPSIASVSLISNPETQQKADTQKFITSLLQAYVKMDKTKSPEYALLYYLKEAFDAGQLSAKEALLKSVNIFFSEKTSTHSDNSYTWAKDNKAFQLMSDAKHHKTILDVFNVDSKVKGFFIRLLKNQGVFPADAKINNLNDKHIIALANILTEDNSIDRHFNRSAPKATLRH